MQKFEQLIRTRAWKIGAFLFVAVFAVGGFFYPILGLVVFGLMVAALIMNARRRRSFCAGFCPNGTFLAAACKPASRDRKLPRALTSPNFRRMLCGVMIFCMIGLIARSYPDPVSVGRVFWTIYVIALSIGVAFGLLYKPRSWCAVCPLGTLQDTIGSSGRKEKET